MLSEYISLYECYAYYWTVGRQVPDENRGAPDIEA